jgi:hypothetical protein
MPIAPPTNLPARPHKDPNEFADLLGGVAASLAIGDSALWALPLRYDAVLFFTD